MNRETKRSAQEFAEQCCKWHIPDILSVGTATGSVRNVYIYLKQKYFLFSLLATQYHIQTDNRQARLPKCVHKSHLLGKWAWQLSSMG